MGGPTTSAAGAASAAAGVDSATPALPELARVRAPFLPRRMRGGARVTSGRLSSHSAAVDAVESGHAPEGTTDPPAAGAPGVCNSAAEGGGPREPTRRRRVGRGSGPEPLAARVAARCRWNRRRCVEAPERSTRGICNSSRPKARRVSCTAVANTGASSLAPVTRAARGMRYSEFSTTQAWESSSPGPGRSVTQSARFKNSVCQNLGPRSAAACFKEAGY